VTCLGSIAATVIALLVFVAAHGRGGIFGRWEYSASLLLILPLALIEMQSAVGRALGSVNLAVVPKDVLWRLLIILLGGALFVTYGHPLMTVDVLAIATGVLVVLIAIQQVHLRRLAEGHRLFTTALSRSKGSIADVLSTSAPFWVTSIASMFAAIDVVIVSVMVGPESAGYYYAANRISLLLDFFLGTFCIPAAPLIARLFDEGRRTEITRVTSGAALAAFIAVLGCVVALALVGDIALMAFGNGFVHAYGVLMLLALGVLGSTYFGVGSIGLNMTGHQRAAMYIMIITSVLGLVAMVGATWKFGIWGTAVVVVIVCVVTKAWMAAYIHAAEGIDLTATTMLLTIARRATRMAATRMGT
jgi:O-antigen/teichoic acid export membrane protein